MDNSLLEKIRENLPKDYAKKIKKSTGCSLSLIYKVAKGHAENDNVLNALIQLAQRNKNQKLLLEEKANQL